MFLVVLPENPTLLGPSPQPLTPALFSGKTHSSSHLTTKWILSTMVSQICCAFYAYRISFYNLNHNNIVSSGCLCFPAPGLLLGPRSRSLALALAPNLYLPALAPNLYLPALAPTCIYRPWPPICIYQPWPQFVFTGPGPQFVFTGPSPQFIFTGPSPQVAFAGPGPHLVFTQNLYLPAQPGA